MVLQFQINHINLGQVQCEYAWVGSTTSNDPDAEGNAALWTWQDDRNFSITAGKPTDVELGRGLSREQKSGLTKE